MDQDNVLTPAFRAMDEKVDISPDDFASIEEACDFARELARRTERLVNIGLALSGERDRGRLFEMVVEEARRITHADAGTLYIADHGHRFLNFVILQNDSMGVRLGGATGGEITLPPVSLYHQDGTANHSNVSAHVAHTGEAVNIDDVYEAEGFDFSGPRKYDATTGYRSRSMVVLPLRNHEDDTIGVLQLLNSLDPETGEARPFVDDQLEAVGALASQAAVALTNTQLIQDLTNFLYAFIQAIATAIDAKSPYTGGHIQRVVDVTMRIAGKMNEASEGPFAGVHFSEDELEELKLSAWMHDVGKIVTPEYVVDKSTKLETIFDRVELVRARFDLIEQLKRNEHLERLVEMASGGASREEMRALTEEYAKWHERFLEERDFVISCNSPGEFMSDERVVRLRTIASRTYERNGETLPFLEKEEVENLCIRKGTLNAGERKSIENHAVVTNRMLAELPFPKRLRNVPNYAGRHHEKLDGTGYPDGLGAEQLALQARILAVADIFEALTARDRPYKKPMPLSQAVKILGFMVKDGHIDGDVFQLFLDQGVHKEYIADIFGPEEVDK
ncbi:MAG: HD-GYP domain-containing protein [Desulfovibrionaceae bacterium]